MIKGYIPMPRSYSDQIFGGEGEQGKIHFPQIHQFLRINQSCCRFMLLAMSRKSTYYTQCQIGWNRVATGQLDLNSLTFPDISGAFFPIFPDNGNPAGILIPKPMKVTGPCSNCTVRYGDNDLPFDSQVSFVTTPL